MKNLARTLVLGSTLCLPLSGFAFVSVESDQIGTPAQGVSGQGSVAIDGRSGNTDRESYTVGGRLHYQAGDTGMFLLADHNRAKADDQEIEDNTWVHGGYRDEFQRGLAAEAFVDYLKDDFRWLENRTQLGAGLRFTLDEVANQRGIYAGVGALHEWEDQANADDHYWRLNTYLAYKRQLNEQTRILFNLSYQPQLDHGSDYLIGTEAAVLVKLATHLDLKVGVKYEFDNAAPAGIDEDDTRYMTSLNYNF